MKTKSIQIDVKVIDLEAGQFEGYAAVFGNKDSYGDVIVAGAFADTLAADFGPDGQGVPTYWCHDFKDPFKNIGATIWAKEDSRGLRVRVQLDLDTQNAKQTLKLLKEGRVKQMSFGYDVIEGAYVESEEHGFYYELRKLKLHEVSVVPIGANQETEVLAAKAAGDAGDAALAVELFTQALEHLSLAKGALIGAATAAKAANIELPAAEAGSHESESDSGEEPAQAKSEEPSPAKDEEPAEVKSQTAEHALALHDIGRLVGVDITTLKGDHA
ncbi:HK97 family phage prohead protease [Leucobacter muris]|uniref:HK97 family phage prohead protease n=1 Tax=Leucobacter muris TaxID=1935379 RepID=UPI0013E3AE6B|nr:HK97 family phage prohead protease [Leucobacter muris]